MIFAWHGAAGRGKARLGGAGRGMAWRGGARMKHQPKEKHEMDVTKSTLVFSTLEKGQSIPYEECCRIISTTKDSPVFARKMLTLKSRIENDLLMVGKQFTLRIHNGAIEVLTDAQASAYNYQQAGQGAMKILRANKRMAGVNVKAIDKEQQRIHDHNRRIMTASVNALESTTLLEVLP